MQPIRLSHRRHQRTLLERPYRRTPAFEPLEARQLMAADVVINEIHYDHPDKTAPAEFIELYNAGSDTADLSGWQVSDGISYTIPQGTSLGADQYLVLAQDPNTARQLFAVDSLGPWQGRLANSGETILLSDAEGTEVDRVDYQLGFPWPTVGDQPGHSIELIHPSFQNDVGGNWRRAETAGQADRRAAGPRTDVAIFSRQFRTFFAAVVLARLSVLTIPTGNRGRRRSATERVSWRRI